MMLVSAPNDSIMMFLYISTYILSCCQHTRMEQDCLNIYGMINGLNKNTLNPASHNTICDCHDTYHVENSIYVPVSHSLEIH